MKALYRQPVARSIAVIHGGYLVYYLVWRATSTLNPDALGFSLALLAIESTALLSFGLFAMMTWDVHHISPFRFRPGAVVDIYIPTGGAFRESNPQRRANRNLHLRALRTRSR